MLVNILYICVFLCSGCGIKYPSGTINQVVTYLNSFHGTHHKNSLQDAGSEPTQQALGAVQATVLIPRTVAEELKHPEPEGTEQRQQGIMGHVNTGLM